MPGSDSSDRFAESQAPANVVGEVLEELLAAAGRRESAPLEAPVRPDVDRQRRKGVPEIIMADRKRPDDVLVAARVFAEQTGRALLSRVGEPLLERLRADFSDCRVEAHAASRMVVIKRPEYSAPVSGGQVGVITAGTSDLPAAEEAAVVAAEMGCRVHAAYDVGVAGLHRLTGPLRAMLADGVDVIVVAAGMDGALPSVVAGLVGVPVIGLPTSVGYGLGGKGLAALLSMLQTCSPGLTVVNIDNGIGAGASAGLIANRVAAAKDSGAATATGRRGGGRRS